MKPGLFLPFALVGISALCAADDPRCSLSFRQPTAVGIIARSIATVGGFNVAVDPTIPAGLSFEVSEVPATEALERLVGQCGMQLTRLSYTRRATYLISQFPRDPATMTEVTAEEKADPADFEFRVPTPVSTILKAMGTKGGIPVRWSGSMDPFITLELREVTPLQAIQVVRDLLAAPMEKEGDVWVLGMAPAPVVSGTTGMVPPATPPAAPPGTDPLKRAFGNANAPAPGPSLPGTGQPPPMFKVLGITGEEPDFVAVIEFRGETYIVNPGTDVPDEWQPEFKVTSITASHVEVFVPSMNRTIRRGY